MDKKRENEKKGKRAVGLLILIMFFGVGVLAGFVGGYKSGMRDAIEFGLKVADRIDINGNVTVSINDTMLQETRDMIMGLYNQSLQDLKNESVNRISQPLEEINDIRY